MNTVFKFYYQGWLLLGLASAYVITIGLRRITKGDFAVSALAVVSLTFFVACALFPIAGVYAKTGGFARSLPTLDSTAFVAESTPDVMAAVEWVELNTTPDEIVLEGKGDSYTSTHNRISTLTGRPTLLGWDGHESQWRGNAFGTMAKGRNELIEQVYRSADSEEIPQLLEQWGIDYVFVGPAEISNYGITSIRLDEMSSTLDTVFARGLVRIFRRRDA